MVDLYTAPVLPSATADTDTVNIVRGSSPPAIYRVSKAALLAGLAKTDDVSVAINSAISGIPPATATDRGTVKVPAGSGLAADPNGVLSVDGDTLAVAAPVASTGSVLPTTSFLDAGSFDSWTLRQILTAAAADSVFVTALASALSTTFAPAGSSGGASSGGTGSGTGGTTGTTASPLLDAITAVPVGAWGLRKLRAAYTGAFIQVRRSSDNTLQDFGAASGSNALDTAALLTFCGTGDGFVTKLYGQGTAANTASTWSSGGTTTVGARIVIAGALVTVNGKPSMDFGVASGSVPGFRSVSGFTARAGTILAVCRDSRAHTAGGTLFTALSASATTSQDVQAINIELDSAGQALAFRTDSTLLNAATPTTLTLFSTRFDTNGVSIQVDSNTKVTTTSTAALAFGNPLLIGSQFRSSVPFRPWLDMVSEMVVYPAALSDADVAALKANQKANFGTA